MYLCVVYADLCTGFLSGGWGHSPPLGFSLPPPRGYTENSILHVNQFKPLSKLKIDRCKLCL